MSARTFTVVYEDKRSSGSGAFRVLGATALDKALARLLLNTEVDLQEVRGLSRSKGECSCAPGDACPAHGFLDALGNAPAAVAAFPKPTARKVEKQARRAARALSVGELRRAVMSRANGVCECGCKTRGRLEMDHFLGGSGRRRALESVETCWALTPEHHREKGENWPNAEYWRQRFLAHCRRHGYELPASTASRRHA